MSEARARCARSLARLCLADFLWPGRHPVLKLAAGLPCAGFCHSATHDRVIRSFNNIKILLTTLYRPRYPCYFSFSEERQRLGAIDRRVCVQFANHLIIPTSFTCGLPTVYWYPQGRNLLDFCIDKRWIEKKFPWVYFMWTTDNIFCVRRISSECRAIDLALFPKCARKNPVYIDWFNVN